MWGSFVQLAGHQKKACAGLQTTAGQGGVPLVLRVCASQQNMGRGPGVSGEEVERRMEGGEKEGGFPRAEDPPAIQAVLVESTANFVLGCSLAPWNSPLARPFVRYGQDKSSRDRET